MLKYILLVLTIILSSCKVDNYSSVLNYKNATVISKSTHLNRCGEIYTVELRSEKVRWGGVSYYKIFKINIPQYEYNQIKVGDVIN